MKKLFVCAFAACFALAACCNKTENQPEEATAPVEEKSCPEMEKCKAQCEAWQNWDQQTDEQKAELIADRKAKIEEAEARKAECEAKKAEFEAKKAEFEANWAANWAKFDEMSMDEQKALIDDYMMFNAPCPKPHHCQKAEGCGPRPEGCQNHEGCKKHEGCPKAEGKCCKGKMESCQRPGPKAE